MGELDVSGYRRGGSVARRVVFPVTGEQAEELTATTAPAPRAKTA
ncbi:hypothetical protein [Streptomyces shenzhenensis]|nr:hypothetical protein [Streptomyces shenzhenensis]